MHVCGAKILPSLDGIHFSQRYIVYPTKEEQLEADRAFHVLYKKRQKLRQNYTSCAQSRLHHLKKLGSSEQCNSRTGHSKVVTCNPRPDNLQTRPLSSRGKRPPNKRETPKRTAFQEHNDIRTSAVSFQQPQGNKKKVKISSVVSSWPSKYHQKCTAMPKLNKVRPKSAHPTQHRPRSTGPPSRHCSNWSVHGTDSCSSLESLSCVERETEREFYDLMLRLDQRELEETLSKITTRQNKELRVLQKEKCTQVSQVTLEKYKVDYSQELERRAALEAILKSLDNEQTKLKSVMEKQKEKKEVSQQELPLRLLSGQTIPQLPSSDSNNFTPTSPMKEINQTVKVLQQIKQNVIHLFPQAKQKITERFSLSKHSKSVPKIHVMPVDCSSKSTAECSKNSKLSETEPTSVSTIEHSSVGSNEQENTDIPEDNSYNTLGSLSNNRSSDVNENRAIIHRRPTPPAFYRPSGYPVRGVVSCQSSLRQIKEHAPTNFKNEFSTPLPVYPQAISPYSSQRSRLGMKYNHVQVSSSEHTELYEERMRQSREQLRAQESLIRESLEALVPPKRTLGEFYAAESEANPMPTPSPPVSPTASKAKLLGEGSSQQSTGIPTIESQTSFTSVEKESPCTVVPLQDSSATMFVGGGSLKLTSIDNSMANVDQKVQSASEPEMPAKTVKSESDCAVSRCDSSLSSLGSEKSIISRQSSASLKNCSLLKIASSGKSNCPISERPDTPFPEWDGVMNNVSSQPNESVAVSTLRVNITGSTSSSTGPIESNKSLNVPSTDSNTSQRTTLAKSNKSLSLLQPSLTRSNKSLCMPQPAENTPGSQLGLVQHSSVPANSNRSLGALQFSTKSLSIPSQQSLSSSSTVSKGSGVPADPSLSVSFSAQETSNEQC